MSEQITREAIEKLWNMGSEILNRPIGSSKEFRTEDVRPIFDMALQYVKSQWHPYDKDNKETWPEKEFNPALCRHLYEDGSDMFFVGWRSPTGVWFSEHNIQPPKELNVTHWMPIINPPQEGKTNG